jgi:hypothetical protein
MRSGHYRIVGLSREGENGLNCSSLSIKTLLVNMKVGKSKERKLEVV